LDAGVRENVAEYDERSGKSDTQQSGAISLIADTAQYSRATEKSFFYAMGDGQWQDFYRQSIEMKNRRRCLGAPRCDDGNQVPD
jgi:hypothetical protein